VTAEGIARGLGGRRCGRGWIARCPGHEDKRPSLSIAERDGRVLVHCRAGCTQSEVLAALRARGLWPERERIQRTPAERAAWAAVQRDIETDLPTARLWRRAAAKLVEELLDWLKSGLFDATTGPRPEAFEIQRVHGLLESLRGAEGAALVGEFRWWLKHYPGWTSALLKVAERRQRAERRALVAFLRSGDAGAAA
jgi:hypothetical protein